MKTVAFAASLAVAVALVAVVTAADESGQSPSTVDANAGNWTVDECIMAQFAVDIKLINATAPNETLVVTVPVTAKADQGPELCGNETQDLTLYWHDKADNSSDLLPRNLTLRFGRINDTAYGVNRIYGWITLAYFDTIDPSTNETVRMMSSVDVDSNVKPGLIYKVPLRRSYLCADPGPLSLEAHLHYNASKEPPQGTQLPNATLEIKGVHLDAFRTKEAPPKGFQVPMDCDYQPNDIVPIAVGVALAALVVLVLVAYLYGRRKSRQRGYQSV